MAVLSPFRQESWPGCSELPHWKMLESFKDTMPGALGICEASGMGGDRVNQETGIFLGWEVPCRGPMMGKSLD